MWKFSLFVCLPSNVMNILFYLIIPIGLYYQYYLEKKKRQLKHFRDQTIRFVHVICLKLYRSEDEYFERYAQLAYNLGQLGYSLDQGKEVWKDFSEVRQLLKNSGEKVDPRQVLTQLQKYLGNQPIIYN